MIDIAIPYGGYWSTPFAKWQGTLSRLHSLRFAAHVARHALAKRRIDPSVFDFGALGLTVPQTNCFYGLPWLMAELGAEQVAGPTISQACATGARLVTAVADEIRCGAASVGLAISGDRTSNGPHLYYPDPSGVGGTGAHEDWVLENFARDPWADMAMVQTAENVAKRYDISTAEQNDATLMRYAQYQDALANDRAFQRRYMDLPFEAPDPKLRKTVAVMQGDEGVHPTTAEALAGLRPVMPGGTVTYGGQTHPADGNAAIILCRSDRAADLSSDPKIAIRVIGMGQARAEKGFMPAAPIPAAQRALSAAGVAISDIKTIKSHNPFIVNDIAFARSFGIDVAKMNNFGCSLVWGHPQGPTGLRALIELIEELALVGGGYGLFQGCAAGDSAMALVVKVDDLKT